MGSSIWLSFPITFHTIIVIFTVVSFFTGKLAIGYERSLSSELQKNWTILFASGFTVDISSSSSLSLDSPHHYHCQIQLHHCFLHHSLLEPLQEDLDPQTIQVHLCVCRCVILSSHIFHPNVFHQLLYINLLLLNF